MFLDPSSNRRGLPRSWSKIVERQKQFEPQVFCDGIGIRQLRVIAWICHSNVQSEPVNASSFGFRDINCPIILGMFSSDAYLISGSAFECVIVVFDTDNEMCKDSLGHSAITIPL